jgi:transcriptional regulator with XRE-family HTH domain
MDVASEKKLLEIAKRLRKAIDGKKPTYGAISAIANETGINRATLSAMYTGRNLPNAEIIATLCDYWPQYGYWIISGKTIPEAGQTSPDLEQLEELKRRVGEP